MPQDSSENYNAFVTDVTRLTEAIQKTPLLIACCHLVFAVSMMMISLFGGGNLPLTYGGILSLLFTALTQISIFGYLYIKNAPRTILFTDLMRTLLISRPYLALSFGVSPILICLFLCSAVIGIVHLSQASHISDILNGTVSYDFLPAVYSVGMGVVFAVAEALPMKMQYNLLRKIALIQELCTMIVPLQSSSTTDRVRQCYDLENLAGSMARTEDRLTVTRFLDCFCYRRHNGCDGSDETIENCEVLVHQERRLNPPPPPNYWQDFSRTVNSQTTPRIFRGHHHVDLAPPVYFLSSGGGAGGGGGCRPEDGLDMPPAYSSAVDLRMEMAKPLLPLPMPVVGDKRFIAEQ